MEKTQTEFQVTSEQFSGPLDILLHLIEQRKLDISLISLSQVTDDYLKYLEQNPISAEELSDFLVIATKLLFIKSANLLPLNRAEQEEALELEHKLLEFQKVKAMVRNLKMAVKNRNPFFERTSNLLEYKLFVPPSDFDVENLYDFFKKIFESIHYIDIQNLEFKKILKLEKAMLRFKKLLEKNPLMLFDDIQKRVHKSELIIYFLALLHLVRMGRVMISQPKLFGKITIKGT